MDDDDEDYIFCGTCLADPEDGQSAQKRANRELQVHDEKGRQRFHGAFTGGFSAGYFNTVGTKEGWAPSAFVSSRSKVAEHVEQLPEDFMDEEDFSVFGIAPKKIHTTAKFRDTDAPAGKRKTPSYSDAVIPGVPPLKELVQPVAESIGVQILMKMGWKPGQGIGPRVMKGNRRKLGGLDGTSSAACNTEDDDPMLSAFTFAPEDTASLPYVPKDDFHGIGYTGLSMKSVLSAPSVSSSSNVTKSWLEKSKKKLLISGKAFGIGALEEDDDLDVYSHEDMSQYDFSEFTSSQKSIKEEGSDILRRQSSFDEVLDGFVKSERASTVRKKFPLPDLPAGYAPARRSVHGLGSSKPSTSKQQVLTAEDRSLLLGERKFVAIDHSNTRSSTSTTKVPVDQNHTEHFSSSRTASSSGFQPFASNPEKQKRYEEYLKLTQREHIKALQPAYMTEWEKQQELEEFTRASSLYQPLSKMLSSRFTTGAHLEAENQGGILKVERLSPEKVTPSGPSHEQIKWHPAPLLCKRFNVPNPYLNSSCIGVPHSGKKQRSLFDCLSFQDDVEQSVNPEIQEIPQEKEIAASVKAESKETQKGSDDKDLTAKEILMSMTSISEEIAPGVSKPPMDLFKAIFENTSDEEEESGHSDDAEAATSPPDKPSVVSVFSKSDSASALSSATHKATPKQAFGVFANLDLDMLNSGRLSTSNMASSSGASADSCVQASTSCHNSPQAGVKEAQQEDKSAVLNEDFYGPRLPPPGLAPLPVKPKSRSHKHSRRKEKHKHHKHKKKSKKKKKKQSSRESASSISSNSSDCDDIDPSAIIKKLNDLHNKSWKKQSK